MRRSTALFLSLLVGAPLVLAACGDDDSTSVDMPMSDSGMDGMMDGGMLMRPPGGSWLALVGRAPGGAGPRR